MSLSTPNIPQLIEQGPGTELHWFTEDVPLSRLAATLVGMANTAGGTVLMGISPRAGQIQGVRDPEGLMDHIFQAALLSDPPLVLPLPQTENVGGLLVLRVTIPQGFTCYSVFVQLLQLDTAARQGVSMSPGLRIDVGI